MNLPSATLLDLWEAGVAHAPAARPAALLAEAAREPLAVIERLPLGRRDARLLQWYRENAGTRLEALTDCPWCSEPMELEFDASDVERPAGSGAAVTANEEGWRVSWRPPDTLDFCKAAAAGSAEAAREVLMECCLTISSPDEIHGPPEHLLEKLMDLAAAADPQADVQLALTCPACSAAWQVPFDIGAFLWKQIEWEAVQLLAQVHELAAACSWSEAEILSLSPARRSAYLQLARSA